MNKLQLRTHGHHILLFHRKLGRRHLYQVAPEAYCLAFSGGRRTTADLFGRTKSEDMGFRGGVTCIKRRRTFFPQNGGSWTDSPENYILCDA